MIVDIDVGNSRIKWRLTEKGVSVGMPPATDIKSLLQSIGERGRPTRIRLSSVGRKEVAGEVAVQAALWGCQMQQAKTTREAGDVRCGYLDPSSMGVDRWLALLAARNRFRCACIVVDAGTATTVDIIDKQGCHLGGYIVPGFAMIYQSLNLGTSNISIEPDSITNCAPGKTTGEAIGHGALLMVKTMIEASAARLEEEAQPVKVIVSGGDGPVLKNVIEGDCVYIRDLVLDGLDVMFP